MAGKREKRNSVRFFMAKIRVLVVDDAVVMRKMISEAVGKDPDIEVVGVAANGKIALSKIPQVNPDLITLDVEMPEMDGLETVKEIRKDYPQLPVIMFSTLTERGGVTTLEALSCGASDYVTKPANVGNVMEGIRRLEEELVPKIKTHCRRLLVDSSTNGVSVPKREETSPVYRPEVCSQKTRVDIVCIGTSTGGPNALAEVFKTMPGDFSLPIVVVQHMPPVFTRLLAERLDTDCALTFHEGEEGQEVQPGHVYIAPGGKHMEVRRQGTRVVIHLQEEPPENSCRPAVDVLFRSVVKAYGGNILGVVMTGMGQDGLRGCEWIREQHGKIVVQDEESSVVWGMPGYVAQAGLADEVVGLSEISKAICQHVKSGSS